ncbi:MAG: M48 family metallopeptidase, partial [Verrucomicrobiae bacterium]|nr:M48 family metallopeptidase [Verrucomicrobiae bacterium]
MITETDIPGGIAWLAGGLIAARTLADLWLERLNQRHLDRFADAVPDAFRGVVDEATYHRTVEYTRARSRLSQVESIWSAVVLCLVLFSGVLPLLWNLHAARLGSGEWSVAWFLLSAMTAVSLTDLPLDWYAQFRLEERFGFNTTTRKLWWIDRVKGLVIGAVLVIPLVWLLLKTVGWAGDLWWLYGGLLVIAFQLVMAFVAPIWLLPLFNKFTPLAEGALRERLLALARRTRFQARAIEVMDGSKRSRHSNAFFTGLGQFRKIVLFDTLIEQLDEAEVEAVLAHEIGHFRLRHVPKMLLIGSAQVLAGFWVLAWLAGKPAFYEAFGLPPQPVGLAFLLFALLAGTVLFWVSPLFNRWSRKHEYEADAF